MTMFIVYPWAATRLWNGRWNAMSFGPLRFRANLDAEGLKARWAALYLVPTGIALAGAAIYFSITPGAGAAPQAGLAIMVLIFALAFYVGIPLATLCWYAKYFRHAADATKLGQLEFSFDATTLQWLGLFLGNLCLAIVTLGFGITYWGYRNWAFMVRHLHVYGTVDLSDLRQSTTHAPREAEGFADAFDVGAI
jgi:uncharacterized membrane protein YjgN (DUF898 family)